MDSRPSRFDPGGGTACRYNLRALSIWHASIGVP
jgi:hypothetical protein